ncbi:MAG: hypothetical protein KJN90_11575 [Gammaproteobacteria bacterium]|nr:hypothetical protein [Gammaproteobacteria bacterium]
MNNVRTRIDEMLNDLKQERDELRLKIKLARMEADVEWVKLEAKLAKLEAKAKELKSATEDSSKDIGAAAKLLGQEIRDGFKNIARHL